MKTLNFCLLLILSILGVQCEKDNVVTDNEVVNITTNKLIYSKNEKILVELKNITIETLQLHYHCRGEGYCVIEKIGKMDNNNWVVEDNINLCFWIVLSDYWGKFSPNEIVNDEISLQKSGKYKIIAGFIYKNDTLSISSNEFSVE